MVIGVCTVRNILFYDKSHISIFDEEMFDMWITGLRKLNDNREFSEITEEQFAYHLQKIDEEISDIMLED